MGRPSWRDYECICGPEYPEIDCPLHGADCVCGRKVGAHPRGDITAANEPDRVRFVVAGCGEVADPGTLRAWREYSARQPALHHPKEGSDEPSQLPG